MCFQYMHSGRAKLTDRFCSSRAVLWVLATIQGYHFERGT